MTSTSTFEDGGDVDVGAGVHDDEVLVSRLTTTSTLTFEDDADDVVRGSRLTTSTSTFEDQAVDVDDDVGDDDESV